MTTPSARSGSASSFGSSSNLASVPISPGSSAVSGDVGIFAVVVHKTVSDPGVISTPTGWTKVYDNGWSNSTNRIAVFMRSFDGTSNDAPGTVSWSSGTTCLWAYQAYKDGVFDVSATQTNATSTTPQLPSVTTSVANDLVIGILAADAATSTTVTNGTSGFTLDNSFVNPNNASGAVAIGSKVFSSAGATGTYNYALSVTKVSGAVTIALSPSTVVTGTGTATLGAPVATSSGTLNETGTGTITLAQITTVASGTSSAPGTGTITLPQITAVSSGTLNETGTGTITLAQITAVVSGSFTAPGTGIVTLRQITAVSSGTLNETGTGTIQLAQITAVGSGSIPASSNTALRAGSAKTGSSTSTAVTTITPSWGSTPGQAGDVGVIALQTRRATTDSNSGADMSPPTGWTYQGFVYLSPIRVDVFTRKLDGTTNDTPSAINWANTSGAIWMIGAYSPVTGTTGIDAVATTSNAGTGAPTTMNAANVSCSTSNELILEIFGFDANTTVPTLPATYVDPSGFSHDSAHFYQETARPGGALAISSAINTGSGTFTGLPAQWPQNRTSASFTISLFNVPINGPATVSLRTLLTVGTGTVAAPGTGVIQLLLPTVAASGILVWSGTGIITLPAMAAAGTLNVQAQATALRPGSAVHGFTTVGTTTVTPAWGATPGQAGDLGIIALQLKKTTDPLNPPHVQVAAPTGWTNISSQYSNSLTRLDIFARKLDGSSSDTPGALVWDNNAASVIWMMGAYTPVTGTGIDAVAITSNLGTGVPTTMNAANVNCAFPNELILEIFAFGSASTAGTFTDPTGFTHDPAHFYQDTNFIGSLVITSKVSSSSGTFTGLPATWTQNKASASATIALLNTPSYTITATPTFDILQIEASGSASTATFNSVAILPRIGASCFGVLQSSSVVTLKTPVVVATGNYIKLIGLGVVVLPYPMGQTANRYGSPTWPTSLLSKAFSITGYTEDIISDPTVRSNVTGPPKARSRSTLVRIKFEGVFDTLSTSDVDNLINFWVADCAMGTLKFTWVHPRTGVAMSFVWMKYPIITPSNGSATIFNAAISLLQFG